MLRDFEGEDAFEVAGPCSAEALQALFGPLFPADSMVAVDGGDGWSPVAWQSVLASGLSAGERVRLPGIPVAAGPLLTVMARLLGEDGCPWDRQQTHTSLLRFLLDEAYEAAAALIAQDWEGFWDELGDVLLQVAFHSVMEDPRRFDAVVLRQVTKLIRRHPHVFSPEEGQREDPDTVMAQWEAQKHREGRRPPQAEWVLPALVWAKRASRRGIAPQSEVYQRVRALLEVYRGQDPDKLEEILGDAGWAVAAAGAAWGRDAEWALWQAVAHKDRPGVSRSAELNPPKAR